MRVTRTQEEIINRFLERAKIFESVLSKWFVFEGIVYVEFLTANSLLKIARKTKRYFNAQSILVYKDKINQTRYKCTRNTILDSMQYYIRLALNCTKGTDIAKVIHHFIALVWLLGDSNFANELEFNLAIRSEKAVNIFNTINEKYKLLDKISFNNLARDNEQIHKIVKEWGF